MRRADAGLTVGINTEAVTNKQSKRMDFDPLRLLCAIFIRLNVPILRVSAGIMIECYRRSLF